MIAATGSTGPRRASMALAGLQTVLLACLLAGCDDGAGPSGPGAVTEGERAALEDAAEMLDTRPPEPSATVADEPPPPSPSPSPSPDGNE